MAATSFGKSELISNLVISEWYQSAAVSAASVDRMTHSDDKYVDREEPKAPELGYSVVKMTRPREVWVFDYRWLLFKQADLVCLFTFI